LGFVLLVESRFLSFPFDLFEQARGLDATVNNLGGCLHDPIQRRNIVMPATDFNA
jgi:hypothetical protein